MVRLFLSLTILMMSMTPAWTASQQSPARRPAGPAITPFRLQPIAADCPSATASIPPADPVQPDDFVELQRTPCFGSCPVYTVQIRADGQVHWQLPSLRPAGAAATVSPAEARALLEKLRASGFWSLCGSYSVGATDGDTAITTVHIAGHEKRVSDYLRSAPQLLRDFENAIDALVDTHRLLHGDPQLESLASLRLPGAGPGYGIFSNLRADVERAKPGLTPLMQASAKGDIEEMQRQLSSGADPNAQDSSGWTALMYATQTDRAEAMKILLDAGASPNAFSYLGQTALMAVSGAYSSAPEKFRLLLAARADVNVQDHDGHTALMFAMYGALVANDDSPSFLQRLELISLLRAAGARTDLRDARGVTALGYLDEEARLYPQQKVASEKLRRILMLPQ
jgi:ankyrin repeat protein